MFNPNEHKLHHVICYSRYLCSVSTCNISTCCRIAINRIYEAVYKTIALNLLLLSCHYLTLVFREVTAAHEFCIDPLQLVSTGRILISSKYFSCKNWPFTSNFPEQCNTQQNQYLCVHICLSPPQSRLHECIMGNKTQDFYASSRRIDVHALKQNVTVL